MQSIMNALKKQVSEVKKSFQTKTLIDFAVDEKLDIPFAQMLLLNGVDVNEVETGEKEKGLIGMTPISIAIFYWGHTGYPEHRLQKIRFLIGAGVNLNHRSKYGSSPLELVLDCASRSRDIRHVSQAPIDQEIITLISELIMCGASLSLSGISPFDYRVKEVTRPLNNLPENVRLLITKEMVFRAKFLLDSFNNLPENAKLLITINVIGLEIVGIGIMGKQAVEIATKMVTDLSKRLAKCPQTLAPPFLSAFQSKRVWRPKPTKQIAETDVINNYYTLGSSTIKLALRDN